MSFTLIRLCMLSFDKIYATQPSRTDTSIRDVEGLIRLSKNPIRPRSS
jgi:hypothetical protein